MAGKPSLALIFKGKGAKPGMSDEDMKDGGADDAEEGDSGPSAEFSKAMEETGLALDDDQQSALWRAIKSCVEGGY